MGTVYKAEQRTPVRRIVAIKLIKLGMDTQEVIARFESERQALAMMEHPSIAKVFEAGATENGRPYFVMEYVPGEPITAYCDKHQMTMQQRLELFQHVCDAVQHAHQKGIIHRDLKPTNILVSVRDGQPIPKVIDFGVAKAINQKLTERTLFTETGQLVGTPEYMSPEQAEMTGLDVDTRSDVYSLGVVLYELLTGALPFDPKTFRRAAYAEIQRMIREVDPPRPSTRLSNLDAPTARQIAQCRQLAVDALARNLRSELEWIPLKAMHKDRTRRYRTATELADDITNYLAKRPLMAVPDSAAYRLRKFLRRNRGPAIAAALVLVTLIAGITGTTIGLVGQARQRRVAEVQANKAQNQADIASAVSQFQQDMLASADPDRLLGDKVTVVQAIEAAIKDLDAGSLKDQPLVEAAVRDTIGRTLKGLGRYDEAQPHLERALKLRQSALPAVDAATAQSLNNLANLLEVKGKMNDAEPMFRAALEMRRKIVPASQADIAESLNDLAALLTQEGKNAEAEPLYREALDIGRKTLPAGSRDIAAALNNLGQLLQAQGRLTEAEPLYREAIDIDRKALPAGHPIIATMLNNLGTLLRTQGKLSEAEALHREALQIDRKVLPPTHPDIATSLNDLAATLKAEDKPGEAESLFCESLEIYRKALPPGHPYIGVGLGNIAIVLEDQGKLAEAEPLFREALDIYRKGLPPEHPFVADGLNNLAVVLKLQGKPGEAEPLLREALQIRRKALPPGNPEIADSANSLAICLLAEGQLVEAEPLFREALDSRSKKFGPHTGPTTQSAAGLATLLDDANRHAEADLLRQQYGLPAPAATQPAQ